MATISKQRLTLAVALPVSIFFACLLITLSAMFQTHPENISFAILGDLLLTAPLAYYLVIRKSSISKQTVLRVFMAGIVMAGLLLASYPSPQLAFIKTWIAPLVETATIGFIIWKFYAANRRLKATNEKQDFLAHCRAILKSVLGSEKAANILASEVAVFYYAFRKKDKNIDNITRFTTYKQSGITLVLTTFIFLFLIETAGMHFLFQLWNKTAAWILTTLSAYSCLQLFAHIRALKARSIQITNRQLHLRNGLMGGDVIVALDKIDRTEVTSKEVAVDHVVKMALIKGLEKHTVAIYLKDPVVVYKAFGITKMATVLLVPVDEHNAFVKTLEKAKALQQSI